MCVAVFVPSSLAKDPTSLLQEVGCGGLFDRVATPMVTDCLRGPGGERGKLIYTNYGNLPVATYDPTSQTWLNCQSHHIGIWSHAKPRPEMLQRDPLVDGPAVELCDGNSWVVPICEYLPKRITIDRTTGEEVKTVANEHAAYIERCNELFAWFIGDEFLSKVENEKVVTIPGGLTFAAEALSKNYRVNRDLVDLLGLIDEVKAFDVARVAIGLSLADSLEAQKKTGHLAAGIS